MHTHQQQSTGLTRQVRDAIITLILFILSITFYVHSVYQIKQTHAKQVGALVVMDQLRRGSADLTNLSRDYIKSGEERYRDAYHYVLDTMDGRIPNDGCVKLQNGIALFISNDLNASQQPVRVSMRLRPNALSLTARLDSLGLSKKELAPLIQAKAISGQLALREMAAMELVAKQANRHDEAAHLAYQKANEMLYGKEYRDTLIAIEDRLDRFYDDYRSASMLAVESSNKYSVYMLWCTAISGIAFF